MQVKRGPLELKIGLIASYGGDFGIVQSYVESAITIAKDKVLLDQFFLPSVKRISTSMKDSLCSETEGPYAAIDMHYTQNLHVFIGPVCDFVLGHVAGYCNVWNTPIVSPGGMSGDLDNKTEYQMVTRLLGRYSMTWHIFHDVITRYQWTNLMFMTHSVHGTSTCYILSLLKYIRVL